MIDYNALWHSVLTLEINLNHIYQSQTPMSPRLHRLDLTSDHTISLISPYKSVNTLVSSKLSNSQFDILLSSSEILSGKSSSILASLFSSFITSPRIMGGMGALWFVSSDCYNQINTSEGTRRTNLVIGNHFLAASVIKSGHTFQLGRLVRCLAKEIHRRLLCRDRHFVWPYIFCQKMVSRLRW